MQVSVSAETLARHSLQGGSELVDPIDLSVLEQGPPVSLQTAERLTCDCSLVAIVEDEHGQH